MFFARIYKIDLPIDYLNLTTQSTKTLYPESYKNKTACSAMLLYNLAESEWITVDCNEPLNEQVLCVLFEENKTVNKSEINDQLALEIYDKMCIIMYNMCHLFHWGTIMTDTEYTYSRIFHLLRKF